MSIINSGPVILPEHLPRRMYAGNEPFSRVVRPYREALESFEKKYWQKALKNYASYREAATALGVDHSTIVKKVARYRLGNPFSAGTAEP